MSQTVFQPPTASKQHTTEKVTLWVKPAVKAELKRLAEMDGLTLSKTGAALLEEAIHQHLHRLDARPRLVQLSAWLARQPEDDQDALRFAIKLSFPGTNTMQQYLSS